MWVEDGIEATAAMPMAEGVPVRVRCTKVAQARVAPQTPIACGRSGSSLQVKDSANPKEVESEVRVKGVPISYTKEVGATIEP